MKRLKTFLKIIRLPVARKLLTCVRDTAEQNSRPSFFFTDRDKQYWGRVDRLAVVAIILLLRGVESGEWKNNEIEKYEKKNKREIKEALETSNESI